MVKKKQNHASTNNARTSGPRRADVAEVAGVSPSTVSIVLNNTPGPSIPETTRNRVIEAARTLGYHPNAVARALAMGTTHTVGCVLHALDTPFSTYTAGILGGFWSVFRGEKYRLTVDEGTRDLPFAGLYREGSVDGLVVMAPPPELMCDEYRELAAARFPICYVGSRPLDVDGDYADLDNKGAAQKVTRALIEAGHRKIVHIAGPTAVNSSAIDRLEGYRAALSRARIPYDESLVVNGSYSRLTSAQQMSQLLKKKVDFTAVCAASIGMAQSAIDVLEDSGRRVPRDVSVSAVDTTPNSEYRNHAIVSVRQPLDQIGRAAASLLMARLKDRNAPFRQELQDGEFLAGDTIAPPG